MQQQQCVLANLGCFRRALLELTRCCATTPRSDEEGVVAGLQGQEWMKPSDKALRLLIGGKINAPEPRETWESSNP